MKIPEQPKQLKIFSSFTLKIIAVLSMIIDHVGSIIFGWKGIMSTYVIEGNFIPTPDMPWLVQMSPFIRDICDVLGAIAFPLFCFLIVQGCIHTRSKKKYLLRLGIFAIISEIPYDIVHYDTIFSYKLQNVMFTLFVGVLTICILEKVIEKFKEFKAKKIICSILIILIGCGLAYVVRGEYVFIGILAMSLMYIFKNNWILPVIGILPLIAASPWVLLAIIPILLYNGQKGKGLKYLFYIFYPTHFIILKYLGEYLTKALAK